jgi:hypothetical protein
LFGRRRLEQSRYAGAAERVARHRYRPDALRVAGEDRQFGEALAQPRSEQGFAGGAGDAWLGHHLQRPLESARAEH